MPGWSSGWTFPGISLTSSVALSAMALQVYPALTFSPTRTTVTTASQRNCRYHPSLSSKLRFFPLQLDPFDDNDGDEAEIDYFETLQNYTNSNMNTSLDGRDKLLQQLDHDLTELANLRPPLRSADRSLPEDIVSAGSSYTRIWTTDTWKMHSMAPHLRYFKHVIKWPQSSTAQKILPMVAICSAWAFVVAWWGRKLSPTAVQDLMQRVGPKPSLDNLNAPLALLLTLRANASMSRLLEARACWGRLVLHTRSLANVLKTHVYPSCPGLATLMTRYTVTLGWLLKAQLRGESDDSQRDVLRVMLQGMSEREHSWLTAQSKRSVAVTSRLRCLANEAYARMPRPQYSSAVHLIIEERIFELEAVVGACERLFGSPIPPTYSRHLSRVLFLFNLCLPLSLVTSSALSPLGITLASMIASYVLLGIDEVGMEIENAFQLMPLQQLAGAAQQDVRDQFVVNMPDVPREILWKKQ